MDTITIADLEVQFRVGVPDVERAQAQRLLLTVEVGKDTTEAAASDDLTKTVDYGSLSRRLVAMGDGHEWKLIETLAADIAKVVLTEYKAEAVAVEVKKFIIPQARYVSVRIERSRTKDTGSGQRLFGGRGGVPGGWR
jgi:dihydroneopterin aldolase